MWACSCLLNDPLSDQGSGAKYLRSEDSVSCGEGGGERESLHGLSTHFAAMLVTKGSGRGLAFQLAPPSPGDLGAGLWVVLSCVCLLPCSGVAVPCFWVGPGEG